MRVREWLRRFAGDEREIRERLFLLVSLTLQVFIAGLVFVNMIFDNSQEHILRGVIGVCAGTLLLFFAYRLNRVRLVSNVVAILFLVFLPVGFFTRGAVYGTMPILMIFGVFYISMVVKGAVRYVYLAIALISTGVCYYLAYTHPEWVTHGDGQRNILVSLIMLILAMVLISLTITFEMYVFSFEKKRSDERRDEIELLGRAQGQFFSGMSHEIRTPINTIVGLNEMILREEISEEVAEDAANIRSACRMLLHLINDILDMSRLNSGGMEVTKCAYAVGDMLSEIVGMIWIKAREKNLDFRVDVDPMLPSELIGDDVKIKQILINLLTNAVKYTGQGSVRLTISFEKAEANQVHVRYSVVDTGMGIRQESMEHLFSAYQRMDLEKNRYIEGTGLGLSIVRQFVDMMGGKIDVQSTYGEGSTFTVIIPQETIDDERIGSIDPVGLRSHAGHGHYEASFEAPAARILVVDDNRANILVVSKLLRATKVNIDSAMSGAEALKQTLENKYDLIFMDHLMPEMDGVECMHRIHGQVGGRSRDARIVALTANAGENNQAFYIKEGFDGYLLKPVTGEELEKEVVNQLPPDLIHSGVISIDASGAEHTKNKKRKKPIIITTEGVCDLPKTLLASLGIPAISYYIHTEKGIFLDGIEADSEELVNYIKADRGRIYSKPPLVEDYEQFFVEQLKEAQKIIHIAVAGGAGSGFQVATEAAAKYDSVTVVDSGHLSSGMGMVVLEAQRLVTQGCSAEEILEGIALVKDKVHTTFVVDSTDFLYRGRRINKAVYRLADSLLLHPVLELKKSKIVFGRVIFGNREQTWAKYVKKVFDTTEPIDTSMLFVTYVGLTAAELAWIRREVSRYMEFENIIYQKATPAIAANSGPGTFGLLFRTV